MSTQELKPTGVICSDLHLPECPRWRDGALYFSDMYGGTVYRWDEAAGLSPVCKVEGRPGGLGFAGNGDLLVCEMERARVLRLDKAGSLSVHADLSALVPSINDMATTRDGHGYVGRLTLAPPFDAAPLTSVDPQGQVSVATSGPIFVANGMAFRDNDRTLIVAESVGGRLLSYRREPDGRLTNRAVFAEMPAGYGPDGICLDDAGGAWLASPNAGAFLRVVEGGEVTHRIQLEPGRFAYACAIGGKDGRTLFLCTSGHYDPDTVTRDKAGKMEVVESPFPFTQA
jgi:sugar lactone lactonase YvrE